MMWNKSVTPRVLVVEDERKIAEVVGSYLRNEGCAVDLAFSGRTALEKLTEANYDLLILDLMLPDIPGEEICRRVREASRLPIIMLTAKVGEQHQLKGFHAGTDDYVTKPFSPRTLVARVRALLKRCYPDNAGKDKVYSFDHGKLVVDATKHAVRVAGFSVVLTPNEFRILLSFCSWPGRIFSRQDLIRASLGEKYDGYDRTIDTHIKNLRRKLRIGDTLPDYITTVYGVGYQFKGAAHADQS